MENTGQIPRYYVENNHPPIIEKDMWEAVQLEMERKKAFARKHGFYRVDYGSADNPFAGKVICGDCSSAFGRKVWNSNDERFRRRVWRCNKKYPEKGKKGCSNTHIEDKALYQIFINVFNAILENKDYFMRKWHEKENSENYLEKYKAKQFIETITKSTPITAFDMNLFFKLVEKITMFKEEAVIVALLDGTEVECQIEE